MARRTTWLIDMGDGTWAVSCMACRIALYRGPKAGAERVARGHFCEPVVPLGRRRRPGLTLEFGGRRHPGPGRGRRRRRPPLTNPFVKEQLVHSRIGWGQPPPGWHAPGWAPLVDPGPRPLQAARSLGRWWWPTLTVTGFLAVLAYVVDHDPSTPGLSSRGLLTVALAATVVVLLTIHRRYGPRALARALVEYATVALLAALLAAPAGTVDHRPADHPDSGQAPAQAAAGQDQPAVIRAVTKVARAGAKVIRGVTGAVRWLVELWHRADQQATAKGQAMATPLSSLSPSALSIWRSHP